MNAEQMQAYSYYKFNKGDRVRINETIQARLFVGGFKDILSGNNNRYDHEIMNKGSVAIVIKASGDKAVIDQKGCDLLFDDNVRIHGVPEYVLEKVEDQQ